MIHTPNKIFVVNGSTGEFDNYDHWAVAAYFDENDAKKHVENANHWCETVGCAEGKPDGWFEMIDRKINHVKCPWDDAFYCTYTGTQYSYEEVPLGDAGHPA